MSLFAERVPSSDLTPRYRLTAASVWRGRRLGLSLETMIETLERHSGQALPPKLRDDLTRWSGQIDRLRLEVEAQRLILFSTNPLVITAVMSHRTLGSLVTEPLGAMRVELKVEGDDRLIHDTQTDQERSQNIIRSGQVHDPIFWTTPSKLLGSFACKLTVTPSKEENYD